MMPLILAAIVSFSLKVSPQLCQAPCTFTVVLTVEPAADNSKVAITVESASGYYRYSELDYGPRTAKTTRIKYPDVPGGPVQIRAVLYKHDGKTWVAGTGMQHVEIIGE